jgi:hypothetical protein
LQHFKPTNRGVAMTTISIVPMRSASEAQADDHTPKTILLFCCLGLVASFFLMTFGVDVSGGWL